jgi:PAT family beta-lactamase induction signal transducer AmpG
VLLLRMTQKQFSATQYALFSSLFALPRILAGPVTGVTVDAVGWYDFFILTMVIGIPGMVMLQRFSPLGVRNPDIETLVATGATAAPRAVLWRRAALGAIGGGLVAAVVAALLDAMKQYRHAPDAGFEFWSPLVAVFMPVGVRDWLQLVGVLIFGALIALTAAATAAARARRRE